MRRTLLLSATILSLAAAGSAFAQTGVPTSTTPLQTSPGVANGRNSGTSNAAPGVTTSSVGNTRDTGRSVAAPGATVGGAAPTTPGVVGAGSTGVDHTAMSAATPAPMTKPMRRHRMNSAAGTSSDVGTGSSEPTSMRSSNIDRADTRSEIAPRLPMPNVGPNADASQYVSAARVALQRGQTGMAQEALERAETRILDRSTAPSAAGTPDNGPMIKQITDARDALARGDTAAARQVLGQGGATPARGSSL